MCGLKSQEDPARAVCRVFLAGHMLVPEPQRNERAVHALGARKVGDRAVERPVDAGLKGGAEIGTPRQPCAHGMRSEIGAAAVERERAPAATEGRDASVAVLQVEQPLNAARGCLTSLVIGVEVAKSEKGSRGVVAIGDAARKVRP